MNAAMDAHCSKVFLELMVLNDLLKTKSVHLHKVSFPLLEFLQRKEIYFCVIVTTGQLT